jgi:hypothetical protein
MKAEGGSKTREFNQYAFILHPSALLFILATINYNSVLKENEGAPEISASPKLYFNSQ